MYVSVELKAPDEGTWVAFTEVTAEGEIKPLGYVDSDALRELKLMLSATLRPFEALEE